jgi:hypothetical protein
MTPAQLSSIAQLHAISQGGEADSELLQPTEQHGTVADLMAFAAMRRG